MKQLYFIRHGNSEMNRQNRWSGQIDTPLTPKGHKQAQHAGKLAHKQGFTVDVIVSSPLQRAYGTALHIATHLDYAPEHIIVNDLFKERNFGQLEGKRHSIHTIAPYILNEAHVDKYGGETFEALQKRASEALEFLNTLDDDTILVVSHGAFGRALYRAAHDLPATHRRPRYKNAKIIRFL